MYKLNFFVPTENKEDVKQALFNIGVGKYEKYDMCAFESIGRGQFRPLDGADPHIGKNNILEYVEEYKVEMVCEDFLIEQAVKTLKKAHPYEEVAFEVIKMEIFS
jgi:hypothetical protein